MKFGSKRAIFGVIWGVLTFFGNQPPHPPTFGRDLPKKTFFLLLPLLCCYDFIMIIKHYAKIMMTMLVMTIMTIVILIMMCRHCILPLNDLWRVVWYLFDDDKNKSNICRHCLLPLHALWRAFRPEKWTHVSSKLGKHWWVKEKVYIFLAWKTPLYQPITRKKN